MLPVELLPEGCQGDLVPSPEDPLLLPTWKNSSLMSCVFRLRGGGRGAQMSASYVKKVITEITEKSIDICFIHIQYT